MMSKVYLLSFLGLLFFLLAGCNAKEAVNASEIKTTLEGKTSTHQNREPPHNYGGWYCPDNILGFPAVDLKELSQVPVITDRLPTEEETKEGKSLMYIDLARHPTAKPLDMPLPRLARYYSEYTKKNELVVVIQAVAIDQDSIVGFRFLNGGNGSSWLKEVTFVSEEEQEKLQPTPFVADEIIISAYPKAIWEVLTDSTYAKILGAIFDKNAYLESEWKKDAAVHFKYGPDKIVSTGIITAIWKNSYIQIDYDFDGYHYVEKFLLSGNKKGKYTKLHLSAGPYGEDYLAQKIVWHNWLNKVKELSERKMNLENYFGLGDVLWEAK